MCRRDGAVPECAWELCEGTGAVTSCSRVHFDPLAALALFDSHPQAGGGGSFGTGSGGGDGGAGGDGDGIAYLLYWLVRLAFAYPAVGVPALIVAAVVAFHGSRRGWWRHQERAIRRARPQREALGSASAAAKLKASDPAFDEARFLARVRSAFHKAQDAWCAQSLEPLRPFVSDGVFERFSLQIEEQKLDGWRQGMEGVRLGALAIAHVHTGGAFETVTVRIPFGARIYRLSLVSAKKIAGSEIPRDAFVECWSFVRRRGAKTVTGDGLIEGKCPNCAAPLTMNQSAKCGHCEALARSGQFDWVLAEITQASEWSPEPEARIPGMPAYAQRDPGMSVQLLEDRASVAFWRKCAADRFARVDPLTRVADEDLCRRWAERLAAAEGERTYAGDCAVGSVRTLGLFQGEERDHAVALIVWDGRRARALAGGGRRLDDDRRRRETLFVFARRAGQRTRIEETFTTAHCRTCGAHDPGGTDPACAYCGSPRTGDASTWLATEIVDVGTADARTWIERARGAEDGRSTPAPSVPAAAAGVASARAFGASADGLLTWAVSVVRADRRTDDAERAALDALAERLDVPPERIDELLVAPPEDGLVQGPRDAGEARAWLAALVELALSDGHLTRFERSFLEGVAGKLGVGRGGLDDALRAARSALYRDSREARRFAREGAAAGA